MQRRRRRVAVGLTTAGREEKMNLKGNLILAVIILIAVLAVLAVMKLFALLIKVGIFLGGILLIIFIVNAVRSKMR